MENKSNTFQEFVKPILVLVIICFVVTLALAFTYGVTKPIIDANTLKTANEARNELLPAAKGDFTEYKGDLDVLEAKKVYVSEVYEATNGEGIVATVLSNSYGGMLTAMIGIDKDGAITNVKVTAHSDTAGVGTKAQTADYLSQYKSLKELKSETVKNDSSVTYVSGASVTSGAVHKAVYCALEQFKSMGGAK